MAQALKTRFDFSQMNNRSVLGLLTALAIVSLGISFFAHFITPDVTWTEWFDGAFQNFSTEMIGALVTFWLFELILGARQREELDRRDHEMRQINAIARLRQAETKELRQPILDEMKALDLLQAADLSGANLSGANLLAANLEDAKLRHANLEGAELGYINLKGASLKRANLPGAILWRANLSGASMEVINLQGASLWEANLSGANLGEANLSGAKLGKPICPARTCMKPICPARTCFKPICPARNY